MNFPLRTLPMAAVLSVHLACSGSSPVTRDRPPEQVLEHHLLMAKEHKPYLQVTREGLWVYTGGVPLQFLPVEEQWGVNLTGRLSRIRSRVPVAPPPEIQQLAVVEDRLGSVSSLDEVISIEDMPKGYLLLLEDHSAILVHSGEPHGVVNLLRRKRLEVQFAQLYLKSRLKQDGAQMMRLEMDPQGAGWLYWITEEGTGVIY